MSPMPDAASVSKVAFLGDYPPRHCGIATFTRDLRDALAEANPGWNCPVDTATRFASVRLGELPDALRAN
ncbi:MAG: hypothetical protein ACKO39_13430 [Chthoniobacterales bacterium]